MLASCLAQVLDGGRHGGLFSLLVLPDGSRRKTPVSVEGSNRCVNALPAGDGEIYLLPYGTDQIPCICLTFLRGVILRDRK